MTLGRDFRLLNLLKASKKLSVVRLVTISRCTALVTAQVKRHTYTLFSLPMSLTYKAPVKSTPVTSKGCVCCTLHLTRGGRVWHLVWLSFSLSAGHTASKEFPYQLSCTGNPVALSNGRQCRIYPSM